ncbi:indolepyruvate ferredoxin oxidoreductase family protein [Mycolicibacterium mageritense]|uniref:indolepyruvate ferredoxin oxidoreductase family protein n=1 Tax=Mycolicibacterium mageritense TaxID=53462 RepID=UPI0011D6F795|nr:indolepyruvate ferredoxin oxidoreductase family protein [Mycolicibacterium mageritense]TXI63838.1 MAG: indolepyruvate ferredoxin oxidoreductase family protein [Mycolicibacterium mageritense]
MTQLDDRPRVSVNLAARYRVDSGPIVMTGVQAVARQIVEQHERDRRAGRRVATFISGYPGSPLAGLDKLLAGIDSLASEHEVRLVPGMNEELAATSVWGSQLAVPGTTRTHDGVVGMWYGKGPGLDRATDALRHLTVYGVHPDGGVLVLVGDDPAAKSSTVPAASERSLAAMNMPILFPRNAEEIIAFGLYGVALSRASGCPVSMKLNADVADGVWTLDRNFTDLAITVPELDWQGRRWSYRQRAMASPPESVLAEADLYGPRWAMVQAFNAANPLDRIEVNPQQAWLGIVAVGTAYDSVRQALTELGLSDDDLLRHGIRILRVGMPYPVDTDRIRALAHGTETVLVVEDKTPFVETQVVQALYGGDQRPDVLGKYDGSRPLIPADGELTAARLLTPLYRVLRSRVPVQSPPPPRLELTPLSTPRTPFFCSGCPHNRSTVVPEGSLAAGGIGCHTLVTMSPRTESAVTGLTQMGGEGAQWIGQAPFTDVKHIFQNVGDGTYFHSGQLAIQACVAAGVNITYKLLYNSAVAMTGAQDAQGALSVPELTHKLATEGVRQIVVCSDDPTRHTVDSLAAGTLLWHRDRLDEAQRMLRDVEGVTVLIYDQQCAADARRQRKRGQLPVRRTRVIINEAVCEGCGDCGVKSNCLSVQPVQTEFGRKTRIDQTSCNTDYSCLDGDCPSFVTVELADDATDSARPVPAPPAVPAPVVGAPSTCNVFLAGIGGTGIVTVNQVLGVAGLRAGLYVQGLDQIGLSQKAGPVTSHLRLSREAADSSNRVSPGTADCLLAFDLLTAADTKNLGYAHADRTVAVASTSRTATGAMVCGTDVEYPEDRELLDRLEPMTRQLMSFDALATSEALFGTTAPANFMLVGAAYQLGALPIPADAIEAAIELNGVAVEANLAAFGWGRVAVAAPDRFAEALGPTAGPTARTIPDLPDDLAASITLGEPMRAVAMRRAAELIGYQGRSAATSYLEVVQAVWEAERRLGDRTEFSQAVAEGLFKLMAYKDEYEVARLLTDPAFAASVQSTFAGSTGMSYNLHPPALRSLGRTKKLRFGPRSHTVLRGLAKAKFLRGTVFDPFGHTALRKAERALVAHYRTMVLTAASRLTTEHYETATQAAAAPDLVRGYESVKIGNIARYQDRLRELGFEPPELDL